MDIFQGRVQIKDGYAWINERPGWGIEVDEALATQHPINDEQRNEFRTPDGTVIEGTGWNLAGQGTLKSPGRGAVTAFSAACFSCGIHEYGSR